MARYRGPSCRLCRASGEKLFLKGERCSSSKCAIVRRNTKPGDNRPLRAKKSEYSVQLSEKQKVKRMYGLLETQFYNYFKKASSKAGITGEELLKMLETRLDNIVFRSGIASSRAQGRQIVKHGHIFITNNKYDRKRVDIPSYLVSEGDLISFSEDLKIAIENHKKVTLPSWIKSEGNGFRVISLPARDNIDANINEQLIVEFYSR